MKKILVPCDFSDQAIEAYHFAMNIAAQSSGEVIVLKIIDLPMTYETSFGAPVYYFDDRIYTDLQKQATDDFVKMKDQYHRKGSVSFCTMNGPVTPLIRQFIDDSKIDLVVMGTQGASGMKEYFVGSNTEKVVRVSKVPVFAVRKSSELSQIKNIVFPSDLQLTHIDLITHLKELQSFFNATLHILLVNTPYNFKRSKDDYELLEEYAKHFKLRDYTLNVYDDFYAEDGIINFANGIKADLIAMGTHSRQGLAHLFRGSIAQDIVNHVECPIWTYSIKPKSH